jgi:hypothetical protein
MQSAWRSKLVRKGLRRQHYQARRIQAVFRGHRERKETRKEWAFVHALEAEELARLERQRRIRMNNRCVRPRSTHGGIRITIFWRDEGKGYIQLYVPRWGQP